MEVHAAVRRQVLLRAGRVVTTRSEPEKLLGAEHLPAAHGLAGRHVDDRDRDAEGMVRCGQVRELLEPADERLRIAHADADVDATEERIAVEAPTRRRQTGDARVRASSPGRRRRRVEANLPDRGSRPIHVWVRASRHGRSGLTRIRRLAGEDELAQVDVPVARTRPADVLARRDRLTGRGRPCRCGRTRSGRCARSRARRAASRRTPARPRSRTRGAYAPAARRAPAGRRGRRCPRPRGRRAALGIRTGVEKRAADRMLSVARADRPAAVRVVVRLR